MNNKFNNNFVISNKKIKNISHDDNLLDSPTNINNEDIIHDSGDLLAKIR
jgi:hypothetical protein